MRNVIIILAAVNLAFAAMWGCGAQTGAKALVDPPTPTPSPSPFPTGKIDHVVIIVQENRSTDNLFNGFPGADTVTVGNAGNGTIPLHSYALEAPGDLYHDHSSFNIDYDGGRVDGWLGEHWSDKLPPDAPYAYVPASETTPYWTMAQRFVFADRMFQSNQGPSFPAHQYLIGGTSKPSDSSALLAAENPGDPTQSKPLGGCDSPADMLVQLIDASGSENYKQYPCFDHQTVLDLLDAKGISWKYYEPRIGGFWDGPDAISHIRNSPTDWARVVKPETKVLTDIAAGTLPQVSWVIPNGPNSDHSGAGSKTGPSWVASIVNAIGGSPYWNSTAIFITWDDWGGWYDHVAPPIYGSYELGFRVPLIIVSPYAKHGYVSHQQHEFGSLLRFVEQDWTLGSLGFTDARSDDFSDCFDFSQKPAPYQRVDAPYPASFFLNSHQGFSPPDDY